MDIKLLTASDPCLNINIIIPHIKKLISAYLSSFTTPHELNFQKLVAPTKYDQDWVIAHCHSLLGYIDFIYSKKPRNTVALRHITQKFIIDFKDFNTLLREMRLKALYNPRQEQFLTDQFKDSNAKSSSAFSFAKINTDSPHYETLSPLSDIYRENMTPFLIRHAIELKIKNEMLGIIKDYHIDKKGNKTPARLGINDYIEFLKNYHHEFFKLPVNLNINDIQCANRWANSYVHTGLQEYIWVIKSIVTTLEPMFTNKIEEVTSLFGFDYRSNNFNKNDLQAALVNYFKGLKKHKDKNYQFILK